VHGALVAIVGRHRQVEMAMGRNLSGSVVPYPHLLTLPLPAKKPIPACGFKFLLIPVPTRVFLPVGYLIPDSIPIVN
jgi:hypothetical protein